MIYKDLIQSIENAISPNVEEFTFGDIGEIDVTSITDFPLAHLVPVGQTSKSGYALFAFDLYILNTKEATEDPIDVLDELSDIALSFASWYNNNTYAQVELPQAEVQYDVSGNRLYGFKFAGIEFMVNTIEQC